MIKEAPTNVMITGSGGREDALAWKLRQSELVGNLFVAPGNGGTQRHPDTHSVLLDPGSSTEVLQAARDLKVGLVVIGPEDPLIAGVADDLRAESIAAFGPGKTGAALEGSKADAVRFMEEFAIPHPASEIFEDFPAALGFVRFGPWEECVVKADGPALGKGVVVCASREEAADAVERVMRKKEFGKAGRRVVIQERLRGYEASIMAVVSGDKYIMLPTSEDHKQVWDSDIGPNTGGMGVLAPHPVITPQLEKQIEMLVIKRTLAGLGEKGIGFRGVLYPGIMVTPSGPMVLEYNVRFGDPETEAIMPLLEGDLFAVLQSAAGYNLLANTTYPVKPGSCAAVTLASAGYPGKYDQGKEILGLETATGRTGVVAFQAGTENRDGRIYSSGGRVMIVAGTGGSVSAAREAAYTAIGENGIRFEGMHYRTDIGARKRNV